ncbi:MAG: GNAT family N-acetyltransferase [Solirubrobacteraceae bacterium]
MTSSCWLGGWPSRSSRTGWWNHQTSPAAVERDFGAAVDGRDATCIHIATLGDHPFGLIQHYALANYPDYLAELSAVCDVTPGALSVDYLIGDPDFRGRGLGAEMIAACVERVWSQHPRASDVIVPVHAENRASWRALTRAGFCRVAEGSLTPDNPRHSTDHYVYCLRRP